MHPQALQAEFFKAAARRHAQPSSPHACTPAQHQEPDHWPAAAAQEPPVIQHSIGEPEPSSVHLKCFALPGPGELPVGLQAGAGPHARRARHAQHAQQAQQAGVNGEADSGATLRHRTLSFARCLLRSPLLLSALLGRELGSGGSGSGCHHLHAPSEGSCPAAGSGLELTLAKLLALHLRTGHTEATQGQLLALLMELEEADCPPAHFCPHRCLATWLVQLPNVSPELARSCVHHWPTSLYRVQDALDHTRACMLWEMGGQSALDWDTEVWPSLQLLFTIEAEPRKHWQGDQQQQQEHSQRDKKQQEEEEQQQQQQQGQQGQQGQHQQGQQHVHHQQGQLGKQGQGQQQPTAACAPCVASNFVGGPCEQAEAGSLPCGAAEAGGAGGAGGAPQQDPWPADMHALCAIIRRQASLLKRHQALPADPVASSDDSGSGTLSCTSTGGSSGRGGTAAAAASLRSAGQAGDDGMGASRAAKRQRTGTGVMTP